MKRAVLALALALAGALATPARAYVRSQDANTSVCLFWTSRDIHWRLSEPIDDLPFADVEAAVKQSFQTWHDATTPSGAHCSDMSFTYDGATTRTDTGYDPNATNNINLVVFRTKNCDDPGVVPTGDPCEKDVFDHPFACANKYDCWSHDPSAVALTTTDYNVNTGVIVDADVEVNDTGAYHFTTYSLPGCDPDQAGSCGRTCNSNTDTDCIGWDVQNTVTHEIGHVLGLGHEQALCFQQDPTQDATMCPTATNGDTDKRTLAPDDVAGLCAIYPKGAPPTTCTPSGHITITSAPAGGCSSSGPAGLLALVLALAVVTLRRERRT